MIVSPTHSALGKAQQEASVHATTAQLRLPRSQPETGHPSEPPLLYQAASPSQLKSATAREGKASPGSTDQSALAGYRRILTALRDPVTPAAKPSSQVRARIVKGEEVALFDELAPVTFSEVCGQESVKARLRDFLLPLASRKATSERQLRGGALLWGPPACGKTFLARALAGALGARCLRVPLSDLSGVYVWDSERKLRHTLEAVRGRGPAVLFFDDLDALAPRQPEPESTAARRLTKHFLLGLSHLLLEETQVVVLAATTRPWEVEPTLRRTGRFDQLIFVPPPDAAARTAVLRAHLQAVTPEEIDCPRLARQTERLSIHDLHQLCRAAGDGKSALHTVDLLRALPKVRASTRDWLESARNFALFASPGGDYDELREYLREHAL